MTEDRFENLIAKITAWLKTPEGQLRMAKLRAEVEKMNKEMEEQEKVSDEDMRKPMTCYHAGSKGSS